MSRDTSYDPLPPLVIFGDTILNPLSPKCVTYYLNDPLPLSKQLVELVVLHASCFVLGPIYGLDRSLKLKFIGRPHS
jgi:hypothetical protein